MKYIIVKTQEDRKAVVTFDEDLAHLNVSKGACFRNGYLVHSAGFFYTKDGNVFVTDQISESLKIGPKDGDRELIADHLGNISNLDSINLRLTQELREGRLS